MSEGQSARTRFHAHSQCTLPEAFRLKPSTLLSATLYKYCSEVSETRKNIKKNMKLSIILYWMKSIVKEFLWKRNLITVPLNIRMVVHRDQFSSANAYRTLMIKEMELKEKEWLLATTSSTWPWRRKITNNSNIWCNTEKI